MVSTESLRQYLLDTYYYDDGELRRRCGYKQWRKGHALGSFVSKRGYKTAFIFGKRWGLHQLIFLYHKGYIPDLIDHEDCVKTNNRIENLLDSSKIKNSLNLSGCHKDNVSGYLGVTYRKDTKKYLARFRNTIIGNFKTPQEAHLAYVDFRANEGIKTRGAERIIPTD